MSDNILLGKGREMMLIPRQHWAVHLRQAPEHAQERLAFMTEDHHRVRNYVVRELPVEGLPLEPTTIARVLELPLEQVQAILADLERNLFFLVRNEQGAVTWAFPVTVEETPHSLTFQSGETLYGA